jgi:hypothetical protein
VLYLWFPGYGFTYIFLRVLIIISESLIIASGPLPMSWHMSLSCSLIISLIAVLLIALKFVRNLLPACLIVVQVRGRLSNKKLKSIGGHELDLILQFFKLKTPL